MFSLLRARSLSSSLSFHRSFSSISSQLSNPSLFRDQSFIDGNWVNSASGSRITVVNPATGDAIGSVPHLSASEVSSAIQAAHAAFPHWSGLTGKQRGDLLRKWHDLMIKNERDLARILTLENGKPLAEAVGEIGYSASFFDVFASEASRTFGTLIPSPVPGTRISLIKQPVGVVGAITPWNFPTAMITRKVGAALAAGCTAVLKSSEITPFSALALCELAQQAGIPRGVLNVVNGSPQEIGQLLTSSPLVRKITFTGSTRVGKILMKQSADTVKRMSMELGGNAPFIVFNDANIDKAVQGAILAKFRNAGQTCVTANRFFVEKGVYEEFCNKFAEKVKQLKVGDGLKEGSIVGPLINQAGVVKVQGQVDDAIKKGAKVLVGGKRITGPNGAQYANVPAKNSGNFFEPTVIAGARPDMLCFGEETFGPVAFIFPFSEEKEVIHMANDTTAGLAAYVFTESQARAWRVMESLQYGMVGVNQGSVSQAVAPFGGVKESGMGREGSHIGLDDYLDYKTAHFNVH